MSYFGAFTRYMEKVYGLITQLEEVEDGRQNPVIPLASVLKGLFYGSSLGWGSIVEIERECRDGGLRHRIGPISDDTFGYALMHADVEAFEVMMAGMARALKRNGVLREGLFRSKVVAVVDGIEVSHSFHRHCSTCLERKVVKGGREKTQWYHKVVVCCLVGGNFPIPIGLEFMNPGEGEVACAERLLTRLIDALGIRFIDIVVGDALYCTPGFFETSEALGLIPVSILKENQEALLQEATLQQEASDPVRVLRDKKIETTLWDLPQVLWATADRDVRVVWAEREKIGGGEEKPKGKKQHKHRKTHHREANNEEEDDRHRVFVFPQVLADMPVELAYSLGCHRWDIDATLFMEMRQYWHLKHAALHSGTAYPNLLHIRFLAYLAVHLFFHRHINARRKRKMAGVIVMFKWLYVALIHEDPRSQSP